MKNIIIPIANVLIVLTIKIIYDYRLYIKRLPVDHQKEWVMMAIGFIPAIILFTYASKLIWYLAAPLSALMIAFFVWFFFDGIYNVIRGQSFWFTGSDNKPASNTSKFDLILKKLTLWQLIAIKVTLLIVPILVYIFTK